MVAELTVEARLRQWYDGLDGPDVPCLVGLSGGMDSTVLLHGLCQLRADRNQALSITALHLNHNLHPSAGQWQDHCAELCAMLAVPLITDTLAAGALQSRGGSLEAAARTARYDFFAAHLQQPGAALLLAHHADDQTETLLLRLLQGRGLLPMPTTRPLAGGALWRPLLALPRATLLAYAQRHGLHWLNDPSNTDEQLDRNYLRHRVLPQIQARWPEAGSHLQRVASVSVQRGDALARLLADRCRLPVAWCQGAEGISILRGWLGRFSEYEVTDRALKEFCRQLSADGDRAPRLTLAHGELARDADEVCYRPAD